MPETFGAGVQWKAEVAKTSSYPIVAGDNGTLFTNSGAGAGVTFTLPAIAPNLRFGFLVIADFALTVASAEGDNIVLRNDAAGDSIAFSTATEQIGGFAEVFSNQAGTLWYVKNWSMGTNAAGGNRITTAT